MRRVLKLLMFLILVLAIVSCGSSNEDVVKKYLAGTYTRYVDDKTPAPRFYKEIVIKHLKGNKYRIKCTGRDWYGRKRTPDIYDFEISSITLKQKTDSIQKYDISYIITNVEVDGTTISRGDDDLKNLTTEEIIKKYGAFEEEAVSLEDIEDDVNE